MITQDDLKVAATARPEAGDIQELAFKADAIYTGGRRLYDFIRPYTPKENAAKLDWRKDRTIDHYDNHLELCCYLYTDSIYGNGQVNHVSGIDEIDEYLNGAYDTWFQNEFTHPLLYMPELYVFMDTPDTCGVIAKTQADKRELGLWARPCIVEPQYVLNYKQDHDGKLLWISRKMIRGDVDYIVVWDEVNRYELDKDGLTAGVGVPHGFDAVPAFRCRWREVKQYFNNAGRKYGHAFMHGVVAKTAAGLQWTSFFVEGGYVHSHIQTSMGPKSYKLTEEMGGFGNMKIVIRDESEGKPEYMQKPNMEMQLLSSQVNDAIPQAIYRAARLRDRSAGATGSSGVSKLMDAVPEMQSLKAVASWFQGIDKAIVEFIVRNYQEGYDMAAVSVTYPTSFDLTTAADDLDQIAGLALAEKNAPDMPQSRTALRLLKEQAIRKLLPDIKPDDMKKITAELSEPPEPLALPPAVTPVASEGDEPGNEPPDGDEPTTGDSTAVYDAADTPLNGAAKKKPRIKGKVSA